MRQTRLTIKRRKQMKRNLYIKPLVTVYIAFLLLALTVDGTAARFNDITSVEGTFQVGEWTPDIPDDDEDEDDGEGWDKSSLTFEVGANGSCEQIVATVKNSGEDMTSPWKYHVYRAANLTGKPDWQRVSGFEGKTELLGKAETDELTFNPDKNGRYHFKFVRPDGHPGDDNGGKSDGIKLENCVEEQSVNMQENSDKDELNKEKNEVERGEGQEDKGNNSEQSENKGSSNQENNEEQVEEDTESKQDNGNNKENNQESEQKSKDQETKEESTDENAEDSSTDSADDKDDKKKKQQDTKNEQQQESKREKETAETDSTDDKQQDDQASKPQGSKDDDTQVKEEESSKEAQNEKE